MRAVRVLRQNCPGLLRRSVSLETVDTPSLSREHEAFQSVLAWKLEEERQSRIERATRIREGRYRFLAHEQELPDPVDWQRASQCSPSRLWTFRLHYHEFLLDLAAAGRTSPESGWFRRAWGHVGQWIQAHPYPDRARAQAAWHPYCISRRLPVWILLWTAGAPPRHVEQAIRRSMAVQAAFLARNLEWDVRGNHLLENAKALIWMGVFFDGPRAARWLKRGARTLQRELREQILPHGEHFERSPMYHARMLELVLDIRDVTQRVMFGLSSQCGQVAGRMAAFLREVLHPDGRIPLLGDSCFDEAPAPRSLLKRASTLNPRPAPDANRHPRND